ncbi:MAG: hypothetical protein AAFU49_19270 [Pseudomonadota bacterium]
MSFLQIGSWNIEHLSGRSRKEKRQSAYALADHIELAGVDIIALQEIYVTDPEEEVRLFPDQPVIASSAKGTRRNRDLDIVCYLLEEHLGSEWAYLILPNRSEGDTTQLCAVLWNDTKVSQTGLLKIPVSHKEGDLNLWDRTPHAVKMTFRMKVWREFASAEAEDGTEWRQVEEDKSLSLIPLHMKSNYGGSTKNMRVREAEAKTLCAQLDRVRAEIDESLVLIGDTNVLKFDEPAITCFIDNGLIDLNNTDSSTYWSRRYGDSPFDRAFVAEDRPEFKYSRQYVLRSADLEAHDQLLSDHYMIKISVKSYLDDGDPRPALG